MSKNHATKPKVSEKKPNPKESTYCYFSHWTQEGTTRTFQGSRGHIHHAVRQCGILDKAVSSFGSEATRTDAETAKVQQQQQKEGGNCASFRMSWLLNCLSSWSGNFFPHVAARIYCLTLEMKRQPLRCQAGS